MNDNSNPYMTNTGILISDIYILTYAKMKVIFQVCRTTPTSVFLIELATKKYKDGYTLTKKYHASKKPLIIKYDNVFSRSTYEVPALREDKKLPIQIDATTDIFWEALKYNKYPKFGTFLAIPFTEHRDTYWKKPKLLEKIEYA